MMTARGWMMTAAMLAALALAGCKSEAEQSPAEQGVPVTLTSPRVQDVPIVTHVVGRLAQSRFTTLGAELAGRVTDVPVEAGDPVRKGQLLVRIDDRDARAAVERAGSRLASLQAQLSAQRKMVNRLRHLREEHFVTQARLDEAEARLTSLEKRLAAAKVDLAQARRQVRRARVLAPFDGRIQHRFVAPGDFIGLGKPLVSLAGQGAAGLHARLPFPETMLGRIRPGLKVRLHTFSGCDPVETRISEVTPKVSERNGAFVARADLPEGMRGACWRAGAAVAADIELDVHANGIVVPEAAVVLRPSGSVVYVVENGTARERRVRVGVRLDGAVEILDGLRGDERIALDGAAWLSDGAAVRIGAAEPKR
ncbi:MAG: efflux RND transporter periplasmic adaptor subunit [Mariprofundaceae bacterium]